MPLPNSEVQPNDSSLPRDHLWVVGWLAYSLLALGFFAWQDAWLSFMCITR